MSLQLAVSLPPLYEQFPDVPDLVARVAKIGYRGIEIWRPDDRFEILVASAGRHGLAISAILGHAPKAALNLRDKHDEAAGQLLESIRLACKHGIPNVIVLGGNRTGDAAADADAMEPIAECLGRVLPAAEEAGVTLVVELLNSKVNHPGYIADHTAWGVALCEKLAHPRLRLLYDIYHMQIMEGDIIRTIREHHQWIGHYHAAGVPGRHEIGDAQELNYPAICAAIRETGFTGFLAMEFSPAGDPVEALREAHEKCA